MAGPRTTLRWRDPNALARLEVMSVEAGMDLGPFLQLAAIRGARAAVAEALSRPVAEAAPADPDAAVELQRLDGLVAGHLGDFMAARRAIRMGRVRAAGVVVFDPCVSGRWMVAGTRRRWRRRRAAAST
jgi:hypothetical protein